MAERLAGNAVITLVARASLPALAAAALWFVQETVAIRRELVTLSERQVAIAERVSVAITEDRRRIEGLENARERSVTETVRLAREIADINLRLTTTVTDLNGALRETNALMRGLEQRIDGMRLRAGSQ